MGKIALDTMQANERALRASYRRSLENRLLETTLSGLNVKHSRQKPIGERICYAAGGRKKKEKAGDTPVVFLIDSVYSATPNKRFKPTRSLDSVPSSMPRPSP